LSLLQRRSAVNLQTASDRLTAGAAFPDELRSSAVTDAPVFQRKTRLMTQAQDCSHADRRLRGCVAVLFTTAITLRSLAFVACAWTPCGTHFLSHLFNGGLLYGTMQAIILIQALCNNLHSNRIPPAN
jgi:hypothetical protein